MYVGEGVRSGRDGGVGSDGFAAERVEALGVMVHGLAEVTVAMEAGFIDLGDGGVDVTGVVIRGGEQGT